MNKRQKKKKEKQAIKNAGASTAKEVKEVRREQTAKENRPETKSKPAEEKDTSKSNGTNVLIDFASYETRAAFHAAFHKEEAFPDYEGNNLDAVFDMLTEIGPPMSITVKNLRGWAAAADSYKGNIEKLLVRADKENPALTIRIED